MKKGDMLDRILSGLTEQELLQLRFDVDRKIKDNLSERVYCERGEKI